MPQFVKLQQVIIPPSDNPRFARPHSIEQHACPYEVPLIKDMWIMGLHPNQLADITVADIPLAVDFKIDPYYRVTSESHEIARLRIRYGVERFARIFPGDSFAKMFQAAVASEAEHKEFQAAYRAEQMIGIKENLDRAKPLEHTAAADDIAALVNAAVAKAIAEERAKSAQSAQATTEPAKRGPGRPAKPTSET